MPTRRHTLVLAFVVLLALPVSAGRQQRDGNVYMVGRCYTPDQSARVLEGFAATHHDRASWETRRAMIRRGILEGARLYPLPTDRKPPRVIRHGKRQMVGYTVENVAIETIDGFWLAGNLYLPDGYTQLKADAAAQLPREKFPGVLCPHGHKQDKRFDEQVQARSAGFARMGCIVFAYDMIGHGDTKPFQHRTPQTLRLQTWNSLRALDFLESLPDIDNDRLAITGCSGGGTQTFLLSAIDDRIDLAMPVCQISAYFYGGCVCESGMPIHVRDTHETNNVEFAACFAPKPLLMVSNGKDWTAHTTQHEFPYVRNVYAYYDAKGQIENAHFADEGHDYGPSKRAAAYRFLAKHFDLDLERLLNKQGEIDESWYRENSVDALRVFTDKQPHPSDAIDDPDELNHRLDQWVAEYD